MSININIIRLYATAICLIGGLSCSVARTTTFRVAPRAITQVPDSLWDESGDEDTIGKTRHNYATEFNALKYVLEDRYRGYDDTFRKKWYDHLFLGFGGGLHKDLEYAGYNLSPITMAHVSVGKQFNPYHTVRLTAGLGYGYYEGNKKNYKQWQGSVDWIYSLSTFMDGYCPSRLLDVSTVFGFGVRHNTTNIVDYHRTRYEIRGGVQGKIFTGPQGYITVEPYIGIKSRWLYNKFGGFYGVNLAMVYYLNNNLSIEDRMRYMKNRPESVDSTMQWRPQSWRTPWFAELSGAMAFCVGSSNTSTGIGHSTKMSLGRYFSPSVGVRFSLGLTNVTWDKDVVPMGVHNEDLAAMLNIPKQDDAKLDYHDMTADVAAEALINPFGFMKDYSFDQPFNVAIAFGGGVSWLMRQHAPALRTLSTFYTAGLHFSYNLSNDLQVFLEPSYTNYNYKIPYRNYTAAKRFNDQRVAVRLGFTAYTRSTNYRKKKEDYEAPRIPLSFGLGIGTMLFNTKTSYEGAAFNYNAQAFVEGHFGNVHGVRASFEYMSINSVAPSSYTCITESGTKYKSVGLFKNNYKRGFVSLNYLLNVTNLCTGYDSNRMFEAELFAGPALLLSLGNSTEPDGSIKVNSSHTMSYSPRKYNTSPLMGANGGIKIKMNVAKHIAVTLTPQLYIVRYNPEMFGVNMMKLRTFQTLDLGVQYTL